MGNEAGWAAIYAEDQERPVMQDDGVTEKPTMINEASTLKTAVEQGRCPGGMWLGGVKYNVVQSGDVEVGDITLKWILGAKSKGGVHIVCTEKTAAVGVFDEAQGQSSGNAKNAVIQLGLLVLYRTKMAQ